MNKVAILGDTHIGVRGDSLDFHNYFEKFYSNIFFPYLLKNNITTVYQMGDLFDRRKYINYHSLYLSKTYFFDMFEKHGIKMITLLGNHDVAFKQTLEVNSSSLLLERYSSIEIHNKFTTIEINGVPVDIIPWMCEDNAEEIKESIRTSKSQICFGHFEINGFEMDRGHLFKGGNLNKADLLKYDLVISGHFHHKSDDGHIFFVGTPTENTWADFNDPRGFHIFDVNTRELEFIQNPYQMFHKVTYDDKTQDIDYWNGYDFESKKDSYIKIISISKTNPFLFDVVVDKFEKVNVCDISIVEDFTENDGEVDEDDIDQAESTIDILNKHIDSQNFEVDSEILKNLMREIYIEALNIQKTE
jgi:hypothetical protein